MTALEFVGFLLLLAIGMALIGWMWLMDRPEDPGRVSEGWRRRHIQRDESHE